MGNDTAVRRLDLGHVIRPASETGGPLPRVEPVLAYLVRYDQGLLLFDRASDFAAGHLARHAAPDAPDVPLPAPRWWDRLAALDPRRVLFAHDCAVWEPPAGSWLPGRAGPPKHGSIRLLGYAPPQEVQQRCTRDGTYEQVAPWRISCWSWCSRSVSS